MNKIFKIHCKEFLHKYNIYHSSYIPPKKGLGAGGVVYTYKVVYGYGLGCGDGYYSHGMVGINISSKSGIIKF